MPVRLWFCSRIQDNSMSRRVCSLVFAGIALAACCTAARLPNEVTRLNLPLTLLQIDLHRPGTLLAGTAAAQLFRSRDAAETWTEIPFPMAFRSTLHAIVIDPARTDAYLVAVSSETPQNSGIFRTVDDGATWQQLTGLGQKQVWALAVWPGDSQVIAAGTPEGVFLTGDGGDTWTRLGSPKAGGPRPVVSLAFDPDDRKTMYAGTPHLAWKTSDGGATWRRLARGMEEDSDIFSINVDPKQHNRVLAGACSGLYRSFDGGGTWSNLRKADGEPPRTYAVVRVPGTTGLVFAGTNGGLMRSANGGLTWQRILDETTRSIAIDPGDSRRIFVATDRGILVSEDGGENFREGGRIAERR